MTEMHDQLGICEYVMYPDGYEELPEFNPCTKSWYCNPKNPERRVILEIYHGCYDHKDMEHQLRGIKAVEGDITIEELIEGINGYLDLYCNPCEFTHPSSRYVEND